MCLSDEQVISSLMSCPLRFEAKANTQILSCVFIQHCNYQLQKKLLGPCFSGLARRALHSPRAACLEQWLTSTSWSQVISRWAVPEIWNCGAECLCVWFGKESSRSQDPKSVPIPIQWTKCISTNLVCKTEVTFHRNVRKINAKAWMYLAENEGFIYGTTKIILR